MAFFTFDLAELLNEEGFEQTDEYSIKSFSFDELQMDMFDSGSIWKHSDGHIHLSFYSKKYAPSKSLMDFMAYWYEKFGSDRQGKGLPCEDDTSNLATGNFLRNWENLTIFQSKRDDCPYLTISLTIIISSNDMASFMNNLAKGFIRSAVNQVGRDGGRVISNKIYNNQNYTPVADATQSAAPHNPYYGSQGAAPASNTGYVKDRQDLPQNAVSAIKPFSTGKIIGLICISLMLSFFGAAGVLIYGIATYITRMEKMEWFVRQPVYVPDRRHRSGRRLDGYVEVKQKALVSATPEAIAISKRNGIIAMCIGAVGCLVFAAYMITGALLQ